MLTFNLFLHDLGFLSLKFYLDLNDWSLYFDNEA
jgi:hypothetical protein